MSSKTSVVSSPSSSSIEEASVDFDTLSSNSGNSDRELDLEDAGYKRLLDEFPVGLWVWKYDESVNSIRLSYANAVSDSFMEKKKREEGVGKLFYDLFPQLIGTGIVDAYISVIKTGKEIILSEVTVDVVSNSRDVLKSKKTTVKIKLVRLSKDSCGALFEDVTDIRKAEQRRITEKHKAESILEKAIDIMTCETKVEQSELNWMSLAIRNLLTYFDESQDKVLVKEKEKSSKSTAQISIADVMTLINNLNEQSDESYLNQFLISFRYFLAPSVLFKKLVLRYVNSDSKPKEEKKKIHQRTLKVIKSWIKQHFYDFESDPELLGTLQNFISNTVAPQSSSDADSLKKSLNKRLHQERRFSDSRSNSLGIVNSKSIDLLSIEPAVLANQMTLITFDVFKQIKPVELYFQAWSKEDKMLASPNVTSIISNFNKLTSWIASEIVKCTNTKKRANIMKYFIAVAWAAYGYRDFETLFTVQIALSMNSVSRLSDTWRNLDSKARQQWHVINKFASYEGNYKTYRQKLKNIFRSGKYPNIMPYMGIYLRDLAGLEEGSVNFEKGGAVNFHKMRMVANIIAEIQSAQKSVFNFTKNLEIISCLSSGLAVLDEEKIHEFSKKCEHSPEPLPANFFSDVGTVERFLLKLPSPKIKKQDGIELVVQNPIYGMKIPKKSK